MMQKRKTSLSLNTLLAFLFSISANADLIDYVEGGVSSGLGEHENVGVFLRVQSFGPESWYDGLSELMGLRSEQVYYTTFDVTLGTAGEELDYADVTFHLIESGAYTAQENWGVVSWLPIKYRRDLALGLEQTISIGILEAGGGTALVNGRDASIYLQGAVELLSVGLSRSADGSEEAGWFAGVQGQIEMKSERFRLILGGEANFILGRNETVHDQGSCTHGKSGVVCQNTSESQNRRTWAEIYAEVRLRMPDPSWELYARSTLSVYRIEEAGQTNQEDLFRLILGASYTPDLRDRRFVHRAWRALR